VQGDMAAVQAAHWRAIQLLGALAVRCRPPGLASHVAAASGLRALAWLTGSANEVRPSQPHPSTPTHPPDPTPPSYPHPHPCSYPSHFDACI